MPGLGDALSKAFEDSVHDLDALVRKAADGEPASGESEAGAARPAADPPAEAAPPPEPPPPEPAAEDAANSGKTRLLNANELAELVGGGEEAEEPPPPPPPPPEETAQEPAPEPAPPAPVREAAEPQVPAAPAPAEEKKPPSPAAKPEVAERPPSPELTSPTMPEPVAPFAQFAPSGVIRRRLRKREPEEDLERGNFPAAPQPEPAPVPGPAAPVAPAEEDVLSFCRRVAGLRGVEDYRTPLLLDGVSGLVHLVRNGGAGHPAALAVCGACPRAGTSTVAVAAALALADEKKYRVLLVDADFRSPGLKSLAGESEGGPDFAALLRGEASLVDAVLLAESENLALLPLYDARGRSPGELADLEELLRGRALGRFLAECRGQFDAVILDAGCASEWEGAAILAGAAGGAVAVVRSGRVNARQAGSLKSQLALAGARLAGSLLTFA